MKRFINLFLVVVLFASVVSAQRYVNVPPDVEDAIASTILADTDARTAALPTQTIYVLQRGGFYPTVSTISNQDYFLWIKGADGEGDLPFIYQSPTASGSYNDIIRAYKDAKIEYVAIDCLQPTGGYGNRVIKIYDGAKVTAVGVEISHDRAGALSIFSDDCSIFIYDSFFHSIGHPKSLGGNGRVIEVRSSTTVDSLVLENSTAFNLSDRIARNMAPVTNYLRINQCTFLENQGFHGGIQAGKCKELIVTNNVFYNQITMGSRNYQLNEQTQPEKESFYVVTIDTFKIDSAATSLYPSSITVKNNNVWWTQNYKDLWASHNNDPANPETGADMRVFAPGVYTATILASPNTEAAMEEPLTFVTLPPSLYDFSAAALANPNATEVPENWFFGFKADINASYGTTAASYTAADNNLPLGDLNWYPEKRAIWGTTSVEQTEGVVPTEFALEQNYPNPFNPSTKIVYNVNATGKVKLEVFDILGKHVATLIDQEQQVGQYKVDFDGSKLSSGVYVYRLSTENFVQSKKMMLMK